MTWVHGYHLGEIARLDAAVRIGVRTNQHVAVDDQLADNDPFRLLAARLQETGRPCMMTYVTIEANSSFTIIAVVPTAADAACIADIITRCDLKVLPQDLLWTRAGDIFVRESPAFHEDPVFLLNRWLFLGQITRLTLLPDQMSRLFTLMRWPLNGIPRMSTDHGEHRNIMLDDAPEGFDDAVIPRPRTTSPEMHVTAVPARMIDSEPETARREGGFAGGPVPPLETPYVTSSPMQNAMQAQADAEHQRTIQRLMASERLREQPVLQQLMAGGATPEAAVRRTTHPFTQLETEQFIRQHHTPQFEQQLSRAIGRDAAAHEVRQFLTAILADDGRDMSVTPLQRVTQIADAAARPNGPLGEAVRDLLRSGPFQQGTTTGSAPVGRGILGTTLSGDLQLRAGSNVRIDPNGYADHQATQATQTNTDLNSALALMQTQIGAMMRFMGISPPEAAGPAGAMRGIAGEPGQTWNNSGGPDGPEGPRGYDPDPQVGRDVG